MIKGQEVELEALFKFRQDLKETLSRNISEDEARLVRDKIRSLDGHINNYYQNSVKSKYKEWV